MSKNWISVKERNPEAEGVYLVTLEHEGEIEVETRWFGHAYTGWVMKDQPDEGLVWCEECGSYAGERVLAWMPIPKPYKESEE